MKCTRFRKLLIFAFSCLLFKPSAPREKSIFIRNVQIEINAWRDSLRFDPSKTIRFFSQIFNDSCDPLLPSQTLFRKIEKWPFDHASQISLQAFILKISFSLFVTAPTYPENWMIVLDTIYHSIAFDDDK
jgi:hypothetical protein